MSEIKIINTGKPNLIGMMKEAHLSKNGFKALAAFCEEYESGEISARTLSAIYKNISPIIEDVETALIRETRKKEALANILVPTLFPKLSKRGRNKISEQAEMQLNTKVCGIFMKHKDLGKRYEICLAATAQELCKGEKTIEAIITKNYKTYQQALKDHLNWHRGNNYQTDEDLAEELGWTVEYLKEKMNSK